MVPASFTGVILAGGASRRMGQDKARLRAQSGEPLLDIMKHLLLAAGATKVVILGRPDEAGGIADKQVFAGPVRAIADYLNIQVPGSRHVVVPIDMPNLVVPMLQMLAAEDNWANFTNHYMPFLATAGAVVPDNIHRIGDLLAYFEAVELAVPVCQESAFLNLNHPHEFTQWRQKYPSINTATDQIERGRRHV